MAKRKSYTNEDQIRSMSSDQLAKALLDANDSGVSIPFCQELPECMELLEDGAIPEEKCLQCVKDWLKRPAFMRGGGHLWKTNWVRAFVLNVSAESPAIWSALWIGGTTPRKPRNATA